MAAVEGGKWLRVKINYYDVDVEVEWGIVLTELKQPMRWKRGAPPAAERIADVLEQG